jgi:hypothetical protein
LFIEIFYFIEKSAGRRSEAFSAERLGLREKTIDVLLRYLRFRALIFGYLFIKKKVVAQRR